MKKLSLYVFMALMFCNVANTTEAYCLINRLDIYVAKLTAEDQSRLAGKEISFIISYEDNLIADASEDTEVSLITGMRGIMDVQEFEKTSNGIRYKNKFDVKGKKEDELIKYKYDNIITIVNGKPTSLLAQVDQSGFSLNNWFFRIKCWDYKFSEEEKLNAKTGHLDIEGLPEGLKKIFYKKGKIRAIVKNKNNKDVLIKIEKDAIISKPGLSPNKNELAIRELAIYEAMQICIKDFKEGCYVYYIGSVN